MSKIFSAAVVLLFALPSALLAQTLVITPTGYYWMGLDADGAPVCTPVTNVIRLTDKDPTIPTDPTDPPTEPTTLQGKIQRWSTRMAEPKTAEAQAMMLQMIASQGERGTFSSKAQMADFTKDAIPKTIKAAESKKYDEWMEVWEDDIWPAVRAIENAGGMNELSDMVTVWEEMADGFKSTVEAKWTLEFATVDGSTSLELRGDAEDRPFLKMILKLLMQLLLDYLTKGINPLGAEGDPDSAIWTLSNWNLVG